MSCDSAAAKKNLARFRVRKTKISRFEFCHEFSIGSPGNRRDLDKKTASFGDVICSYLIHAARPNFLCAVSVPFASFRVPCTHVNFLDGIARFHRNRRYILANHKGLLEKSLWVYLFQFRFCSMCFVILQLPKKPSSIRCPKGKDLEV